MAGQEMDWKPVQCPAIDQLTWAQLDEIYEMTGVDVAEPGVRMAQRLCALEVWARRRAGQDVTWEQVYARGRIRGMEIDGQSVNGAVNGAAGGDADDPKEDGSTPVSRWPTRSRSRR